MTTETAWTFDVGTTTERPVLPDQHVSRVTVLADSIGEAMADAAEWSCALESRW